MEEPPLARVRSLPSDTSRDVAIGDWDVLFDAVKERLRSAVGGCPAPTLTATPCNGRPVHDTVVECALILDQLHLTMAREMGRLQQLELDVFDARAALAQAHAELAGTQAGERRARYLAAHDSLTALPNRTHFVERLSQSLAGTHGRAVAVMYLDLDDFKPINDAHGHAAGDELLRIVAARLSRVVRSEDMVGRIGGDEFACLLDGLEDRDQLEQMAAKLFEAVAAPCKIGRLRMAVHPSIGIAIGPYDGTTAEALLRKADAAMYAAKREQTRHAFVQPD